MINISPRQYRTSGITANPGLPGEYKAVAFTLDDEEKEPMYTLWRKSVHPIFNFAYADTTYPNRTWYVGLASGHHIAQILGGYRILHAKATLPEGKRTSHQLNIMGNKLDKDALTVQLGLSLNIVPYWGDQEHLSQQLRKFAQTLTTVIQNV